MENYSTEIDKSGDQVEMEFILLLIDYFIAFGRIPKFHAIVQSEFSHTIGTEVVQNHLNMADGQISHLVLSINITNLTGLSLWKQYKFSEQ